MFAMPTTSCGMEAPWLLWMVRAAQILTGNNYNISKWLHPALIPAAADPVQPTEARLLCTATVRRIRSGLALWQDRA